MVSEGLSCVGLSFRLRDVIADRMPALRHSLVIASCEEWDTLQQEDDLEEYDEDLNEFITAPDPGMDAVKDHVMLAVRILCQETGQRVLVLLDSGYHAPRLIVVTSDGAWPHTGKFVKSDTAKYIEEQEFTWKSDAYVEWLVKETKNGHTAVSRSLSSCCLVKCLMYIYLCC